MKCWVYKSRMILLHFFMELRTVINCYGGDTPAILSVWLHEQDVGRQCKETTGRVRVRWLPWCRVQFSMKRASGVVCKFSAAKNGKHVTDTATGNERALRGIVAELGWRRWLYSLLPGIDLNNAMCRQPGNCQRNAIDDWVCVVCFVSERKELCACSGDDEQRNRCRVDHGNTSTSQVTKSNSFCLVFSWSCWPLTCSCISVRCCLRDLLVVMFELLFLSSRMAEKTRKKKKT